MIKITNKDSYIPLKLMENIIKTTDIKTVVIEEEQSELCFDTLNGIGKIVFNSNGVYEGNVKYGILDSLGKISTLTFPDGTKYEGEIQNNQLTGNGTYYFNTGSNYKGGVRNGLRHGHGVYSHPDGVKYDGTWENGLKQGSGKMVSKDGMIYEGEWYKGIIQGKGKIKWVTGNLFDGEFKYNKMNGNGYMVWSDTNEKFVGQWVDNLQTGLGIHIWYESKGEQKYLRNRYVGEWQNGFRHGYGVFFYSNGSKYEGTWDQNYKHGFGIFTFYDGSQYIGRFNADRMIEFNTQGVYSPPSTVKLVVENTKSPFNPKQNQRRSLGNKVIEEDAPQTKDKLNSGTNSIPEKEIKEKVKFISSLEAIPEGVEAIASTITATNNQFKNFSQTNNASNAINLNLTNTSNILDNGFNTNKTSNVISNRAFNQKESEANQFKTSMDITDIIECEPEIEKSLRDVENTLLRHLSEIKRWYLYYTNKDKDILKESESPYQENSIKTGASLNALMDKLNKNDKILGSVLQNAEKNLQISDSAYNNDLGFCMELKDLWKFIRECKILSSDFTLAQFNRIFFKGPKNYIEMFMCPDEIDGKKIYDYIYLMINKSKKDFYTKYRQYVDKKKIGETGEIQALQSNDKVMNESHLNLNLNYLPAELEINFDIHNKRQVILLRQFYEAIVRIAYLKFFDLNQPLNTKLTMLIDNFIKFNPHFKKAPRVKQNMTSYFADSSVNSSALDMKVKGFETNLEYFILSYESKLKQIFKNLYSKSTTVPKKHDMTITYNFFFENIIKKCKNFAESLDKYKFVELINIYHKDKIIINEENKWSKESFTYIDNLLESEMIFYEFCEMVFFVSKSYFICFNMQENKNNYDESIKMIVDVLNRKEFIRANNEKYEYHFPKLINHYAYEKILEFRRLKDEEEQKKKDEVKRIKLERNLMMNEDLNVLPKEDDDEAVETDEEDEISSY